MTEREKASGLRSTKQRAAIIDALRRAKGFKSPQNLHQQMLRGGKRVALATVYRNLQSMAEGGEVDVLQTDVGETVFRLCEGEGHHHHIVCRECGLSVEIEAEEIETWASSIARDHGFKEVTHTAEIFGLCQSCA